MKMKKWLLGLLTACLLLTACTAFADEITLDLLDSKADKNREWLSGTDYLVVGEYGKRALADQSGRQLTKPVYRFFSDVYVDRGLISGTDGDGDWGILSTDLDILVPFDYKEIYIFNKNWAMCTPHSSSAKLEFWNLQDGRLAFTLPQKQYVNGFANTGSPLLLVEDANGRVNVYNLDGERVDRADSLYSYSKAEEIKPFEMLKLSDGTTMVDENGSMLLEPGNYSYLTTEDGCYFRATQDGKQGVISANGDVIVPFHKDNELKFSSWQPAKHPGYVGGGYASVVRNDKLYFYDVYGNLTASFDDSFKNGGFNTSHAAALSTQKEGSAVILAADGKKSTVKYEKSFRIVDNGSGYLYVAVNDDYDYALYDWHGNQLLPYKYSDFLISGDGLYLLAKRDDSSYGELYRINYPDVWYVMYADDLPADIVSGSGRHSDPDEGRAKTDSDRPSLSSLVNALEEGPMEAGEAEESKPAKTGNLLVSNTGSSQPTAEPEAQPTKGGNLLVSNRPTPTPAPVETAVPASPAAGAGSDVSALLESAKLLLGTNATANSAAIAQLLNTAAGMLGDSAAAGILQSAAMLAQTDAGANAAAILQLLETVAGMQ